MIYRRKIFERDPPYDFAEALTDITTKTGWGIPDIAFILNVSRGCIRGLYSGSRPTDDVGQAIRKLRALCASVEGRNAIGLFKAPPKEEITA